MNHEKVPAPGQCQRPGECLANLCDNPNCKEVRRLPSGEEFMRALASSGIKKSAWVKRCRHPGHCIAPNCGDFCHDSIDL